MARVRPVDPPDYPALAAFLSREYPLGQRPAADHLARFHHWWSVNPAMDDAIARGWIIEDDGGEIAGFLGNVPIRYEVEGRDALACAATTWFVRPAHRQSSLHLLLRYVGQKGPALLLNTTPNDAAARIFLSMKAARPLSRPWLEHEFVYPAAPARALRLVMERKVGRRAARALALSGIPLAAAVVRAAQGLRGLSGVAARVAVRTIGEFPPGTDGLWRRIRGRYAMSAVRDAAALNWCAFAPRGSSAPRIVFEVGSPDGAIGYAITTELAHDGTRSLSVVDWLMADADVATYRAALGGIARYAARHGYTLLRARAYDDLLATALRRSGFLRRLSPERFLFRWTGSDVPRPCEASWYATLLDGDRGII